MLSDIASISWLCYPRSMAKERSSKDKGGAWVVRYVPREMMHRTKVAAAIQRTSIKRFLLDLVEAHLQELERRGILPKSKG